MPNHVKKKFGNIKSFEKCIKSTFDSIYVKKGERKRKSKHENVMRYSNRSQELISNQYSQILIFSHFKCCNVASCEWPYIFLEDSCLHTRLHDLRYRQIPFLAT